MRFSGQFTKLVKEWISSSTLSFMINGSPYGKLSLRVSKKSKIRIEKPKNQAETLRSEKRKSIMHFFFLIKKPKKSVHTQFGQ